MFLHEGSPNAAFYRLKWLQPQLRKTVSQIFSAFEVGIGHRNHPTGDNAFGTGMHLEHELSHILGMDALVMGCS